MKKYENGCYVEMTAAEEAALVPTETAPPSAEERIAALEAAMLSLVLGGAAVPYTHLTLPTKQRV